MPWSLNWPALLKSVEPGSNVAIDAGTLSITGTLDGTGTVGINGATADIGTLSGTPLAIEGGSSVLQTLQRRSSALPQDMQKRALSGFS